MKATHTAETVQDRPDILRLPWPKPPKKGGALTSLNPEGITAEVIDAMERQGRAAPNQIEFLRNWLAHKDDDSNEEATQSVKARGVDLEGRLFITVAELARILECDPRSVHRGIDDGTIPHVRVGPRTIRIPIAKARWLWEWDERLTERLATGKAPADRSEFPDDAMRWAVDFAEAQVTLAQKRLALMRDLVDKVYGRGPDSQVEAPSLP